MAIQYDKNWKVIIIRRRILVLFAVIIQFVFIAYLTIGSSAVRLLNYFFYLTGIIISVRIINRRDKPSAYKLTWIFVILLSPVAGGLLYLTLYFQSSRKKYLKVFSDITKKRREINNYIPSVLTELENSPVFLQARFLEQLSGFPLYKNTTCEYLSEGESFWERALEELSKAKKYIFLEFFIVNPGYVLDRIMFVLERKAKEGIEVRFIYDDIGCFLSLPDDFARQLQKKNIKVHIFNRFGPILSTIQNNRDHRKIISIDGKTAFTGGVNIGDEYINAYEKYGRWKDAGIMLKGEAAWGLTLIFLQMWNTEAKLDKRPMDDNFLDFYPYKNNNCAPVEKGYFSAYSDNPIYGDNIGSQIYLEIINSAKKYVYINTPYLILDDRLHGALIRSAKSGVDVRIITPHRPDKKAVHLVTRSYYRDLIEAGVRIFEYSLGFNHSKTFVQDDSVATVGTMNLDFRSLYLHFECGVWIYNSSEIQAIKTDFLAAQSLGREVTVADCKGNIVTRAAQMVLRVVAPLL